MRNINVFKHVALSQNVGTRSDLENVTIGVGVSPEVVHGVKERATGNLGATARGVVNVVVLECDVVGGTIEVEGPVVVSVTCSRVVTLTVNVAVGNGDAAAGRGAENNVLTTNLGCLASR